MRRGSLVSRNSSVLEREYQRSTLSDVMRGGKGKKGHHFDDSDDSRDSRDSDSDRSDSDSRGNTDSDDSFSRSDDSDDSAADSATSSKGSTNVPDYIGQRRSSQVAEVIDPKLMTSIGIGIHSGEVCV